VINKINATKNSHTGAIIAYSLLRSVHPFFAQLTLLPSPQNPMLSNAF